MQPFILFKMKKNILPSLFIISLVTLFAGIYSCNNASRKYEHTIQDSAFSDAIIIYKTADDTIFNGKMVPGNIEITTVKSETDIIINKEGKSWVFEKIPPKHINHNCKLELSTNKYHDYFPNEWILLKKAGNFATLRLFADDGFFIVIVINTLNGTEIGRHAESY
jgi:hypothetical protein